MELVVSLVVDRGLSMVDDGELLYRRVLWQDVPDGKISVTAFNDRRWKPSVDLSSLRESVQASQSLPTDGIAQLITAEVRAILIVVAPNAKPKSEAPHVVDVLERPIPADNVEGLPENLAHAQIEVEPDFLNDSRFRKLKEALALLAGKRELLIFPTKADELKQGSNET